jgi:NaMN:DMB phosphoribosyltransferase
MAVPNTTAALALSVHFQALGQSELTGRSHGCETTLKQAAFPNFRGELGRPWLVDDLPLAP